MSIEKSFSEFVLLHERTLISDNIKDLDKSILSVGNILKESDVGNEESIISLVGDIQELTQKLKLKLSQQGLYKI
jgi:hypothetical protein